MVGGTASLFNYGRDTLGVMLLVPTFINAAISHVGGAFYYSIAFAKKYEK